MKYIRTKDGRILETIDDSANRDFIKNVDKDLYERYCLKVIRTTYGNIELSRIIKQSDTIEELCDEYVYDETKLFPESKPFIIGLYEDEWLFNNYAKNSKKGDVIYGAIWTDKGLQFVARMNSEGILELL